MTVLVTGGAGYIGGHVVSALRARGDRVVVVDDLSAGRPERVGDVPLERIDLASAGARDDLADAMRRHEVTAVIHLAARKKVEESVQRPVWYFDENLGGMVNVLHAAEATGVTGVVFSSTAAVYGPADEPVAEDGVTAPVNPYGETKLVGEWMLRDLAAASRVRGIALRYFNVAGAAMNALGDTADSNIVPMVYSRLEAGEQPLIFGDDYDTPDGTCVRDYVHVADVADAHLSALDALADGSAEPYRVFNIGTGTGSSVRDLVTRMIEISGSTLEPEIAPRRAGDPAVVVADAGRIRRELGWEARYGLDDMLRSAWEARRAGVR
ncbi:MAG TPA: UDP-glucose 4-epimerase GalE [Pseudolysinimonas sp.]|nr:UDP-glucose 4-epimerase GalE [Pseudolysinimonas sp.]